MGKAFSYLRYVGLGVGLVALALVLWGVVEYSRIGSAYGQFIGSGGVVGSYRFGPDVVENAVGEVSNGKTVQAVFLGEEKLSCNGLSEEGCVVGLKFLTLDGYGNPLVFWAYGGAEIEGQEHLVGLAAASDGEFGNPINWVDSNDLVRVIEEEESVRITVVGLDTAAEDFFVGAPGLEVNNFEPMGRLREVYSDSLAKFLALVEGREGNRLASFLQSFLFFRNKIIPVVIYEVL